MHQGYCPTEYHHSNFNATGTTAIVAAQSATNSPTYASKTEIEAINPTYPGYNNWSNGYNNYQYTACTPQTQYPTHHTGPPTMVLYPHVYSTVNQNQIHLHLHGSDKLEQYLGSDNALTISSARGGIEIGITTSDNSDVILGDDPSEHHTQDTDIDTDENRDQVGGDPGSVWRPY